MEIPLQKLTKLVTPICSKLCMQLTSIYQYSKVQTNRYPETTLNRLQSVILALQSVIRALHPQQTGSLNYANAYNPA